MTLYTLRPLEVTKEESFNYATPTPILYVQQYGQMEAASRPPERKGAHADR